MRNLIRSYAKIVEFENNVCFSLDARYDYGLNLGQVNLNIYKEGLEYFLGSWGINSNGTLEEYKNFMSSVLEKYPVLEAVARDMARTLMGEKQEDDPIDKPNEQYYINW